MSRLNLRRAPTLPRGRQQRSAGLVHARAVLSSLHEAPPCGWEAAEVAERRGDGAAAPSRGEPLREELPRAGAGSAADAEAVPAEKGSLGTASHSGPPCAVVRWAWYQAASLRSAKGHTTGDVDEG